MKHPETAYDVEKEILLSSDKSRELGDLRIRQLINILPKVNHEIIVEGVIKVFENESRPHTHFQDQEFAGKVLESVNPHSNKDLKEVLARVLKNWNKSVKQLPFWLRNNYGVGKLNESLAALQLTEILKDKKNAIEWWLHLNEASA
jgi:hypothetical protein